VAVSSVRDRTNFSLNRRGLKRVRTLAMEGSMSRKWMVVRVLDAMVVGVFSTRHAAMRYVYCGGLEPILLSSRS
jgi:hypothetical protein